MEDEAELTLDQRIRRQMVIVGCKTVTDLARKSGIEYRRLNLLLSDPSSAKWRLWELHALAAALEIPVGAIKV